jgi:hypothetical protein
MGKGKKVKGERPLFDNEEVGMSKSERVSEEIRELKFYLFSAQSGRCFACGESMALTSMEAAHRIPDRKWTVKLFGREVINHRMNFRGTHSGRCNSFVQLNPDSLDAERLAYEIKKAIKRQKDLRYRHG